MVGLIACSILSSRVLNSTSQITRLLLQWHHARRSLQVRDKVLSYPTDDDPSRQAHTHVAPLDLAVKAVKYSYDMNSAPQFQAESLLIRAGERVAIGRASGREREWQYV